MKSFILILALLITSIGLSFEKEKEIELQACRVELRYTGSGYDSCHFDDIVTGIRVMNVRPPFASTVVQCAKIIVLCPIKREEIKE
jgi:hypothetical protein